MPDKMCVRRYLGFVLLVWFQGALHVQTSDQLCSAPRLNGGYWVPEQVSYNHEEKLTYACDNGRKPAVEGWWATSTCQNGIWSPKPQCIDEKACIVPDILNGKYTDNQDGWYEVGETIRITCNKGYDPKGWNVTAKCFDGEWSSVLVCEKSINACGEPPQIPHAVIIDHGYQDFFAADTGLQYECEDGYTVDGADTKQYVYCITGKWTDGPVCNKDTGRGAGLGGSADVGTGGRQTTSAGSGTQPEGGASRPGSGNDRGSAGSGTQPEGGASRPGSGHGRGSTGSETRPAGGGTSTASGGNERDGRPLDTTVSVIHCGPYPHVPHGDVVKEEAKFLRYGCNSFYTQVGSDTVTCHSNGSWSQPPICKATFCVLDPARPVTYGVQEQFVPQYIKEGEEKSVQCIWDYFSSLVKCVNGKLFHTPCCSSSDHYYRRCQYRKTEE